MSNNGRRRRNTSSIAPSPISSPRLSSRGPPPAQLPQWKFAQVLGELPPGAGEQQKGVLQYNDADEISALKFDGRGEHLAAGDHAGRVIIFRRTEVDDTRRRAELERTDHAGAPPPRYRFATEFQSHELEFDTLHSLEICDKIKKLRLCVRPSSSLFMLVTNDRTVKLWKLPGRSPITRRRQGAAIISLDGPPLRCLQILSSALKRSAIRAAMQGMGTLPGARRSSAVLTCTTSTPFRPTATGRRSCPPTTCGSTCGTWR